MTRAWFARHPRLDVGRWRTGILSRTEHPRHGQLTLSVEQRPFEILRCGTYVGTCLGLGGMMAESAAAVLLDANKRVVYARRDNGEVVARQLLAWSEEDTLVCYRVYPVREDAVIDEAFLHWDLEFSSMLGVEIEGSNMYYVQTIRARDWWDDRPWDAVVVDDF